MSSLSSVGTSGGAFSITGLATGIDTDKIIQALLAANQNRVALLQNNQSKIVQQQTAFKSVEAKLVSLQGSLASLSRSFGSAFDARTVTSSQQDLLTVSAGASATPGTYVLRVNSLAQAAQIASQGFDSPDSVITQGTLQIRVGSGAATTITVGSGNNTLRGLADAINNSAAGVSATIINDGSGDTQAYRLLLTAKNGGASNTISITDGLGNDGGGAVKPVLTSTYVGQANTSAGFAGTATVASNSGAGGYTGTSNNTYTFTVLTGGTVGSDDGIQIGYSDASGTHTGTITLNAGDAGVFKDAAEGVRVNVGAGTLVAGDSFTVDGFVPEVQKAASASVTLGSGSGALTVTSDTNRVDGLIAGVTLNLNGADPTRPVTVTVANDTAATQKAIQSFVDSFNDLMGFIDDQSRFDAETNTAGVLLGDRSAATLQDDVRRTVTDVVANTNPKMNRLSALGITLNREGRLEIDSTRLGQVLNGQVDGVNLNDVRRLFAFDGQSTNTGVRFITGSSRTRASTAPYQVNVTQAAERAVVTATNALAASTVIDETNNQLTLTLDGRASSTISLSAGTYTRLALAQELQGKINADTALAGKVTISVENDRLKIVSNAYGSSSEVTIGSGTALGALGFVGTETDHGQDVAGSFFVNDVAEAALGTGQLLVGNSTNANTADLQVRVSLSASQVQDGPEADLTVTRGIASRLDQMLAGVLDPVNGRMKGINNGFQEQVDDLQAAIDRQNATTQAQQEELVRRFTAMETAVSQLKSVGDFLTAQFAALRTTSR